MVKIYLLYQRKKLFDEDTFREAWTNAVVHNKWVEGIPPAVYWYDDRLEIVSYGTIPNGMTKEDFLSGKTHPVNEELMKIFLQCHIVEQTGHGVSTIVDKYGREAFTFLDNFLRVTIPFNYKLDEYIKPRENIDGIEHGIERGTDESGNEKELSDEEKLIEAIQKNPGITTTEMMKLLNKSRRTVARIISKSSRIIRVGPDFGGHWEIKK